MKNTIETLQKYIDELGFNSYIANDNALLVDFKKNSSFYFEKLKNNNIAVENFNNYKFLNDYLKITIDTDEQIEQIKNLLKVKKLLIFDLDGVVFDVSESYIKTIGETFKYFAKKDISKDEILKVKNSDGMNCDWDVVDYLLKKQGLNIPYNEIANVFQDIFYNPNGDKNIEYLINKEKLLISEDIFRELSKDYDLAVFTGRLKYETEYSLKKFNIDKYFYYFIVSDNLPKNMLKPSPWGIYNILEYCPYSEAKYLGDSKDDIKAGKSANIYTIGVIPPYADKELKTADLKSVGADFILSDIKKIKDIL